MFKGQKGITLIALVITIIVLLILAGVSIMMLSGADNAPDKAGEAAIRDALGAGKDTVNLAASNAVLDYYNDIYVEKNKNTNTIDDAIYTAVTAETLKCDKVTITGNTASDTKTVKVAYTADDKHFVEGTIKDGAITWGEVQGFTK